MYSSSPIKLSCLWQVNNCCLNCPLCTPPTVYPHTMHVDYVDCVHLPLCTPTQCMWTMWTVYPSHHAIHAWSNWAEPLKLSRTWPHLYSGKQQYTVLPDLVTVARVSGGLGLPCLGSLPTVLLWSLLGAFLPLLWLLLPPPPLPLGGEEGPAHPHLNQ